jgi:hypothetical protein
MNRIFTAKTLQHAVILFVLLALGHYGYAQELTSETPEIDQLIGEWDVDLYYAPGEPPSKTRLKVWANTNGILSGSFYGTQFNIARAAVHEQEVMLTFVTQDNTGDYLSSAHLTSELQLKGQTLSVGRSFLMPWRARKIQGTE